MSAPWAHKAWASAHTWVGVRAHAQRLESVLCVQRTQRWGEGRKRGEVALSLGDLSECVDSATIFVLLMPYPCVWLPAQRLYGGGQQGLRQHTCSSPGISHGRRLPPSPICSCQRLRGQSSCFYFLSLQKCSTAESLFVSNVKCSWDLSSSLPCLGHSHRFLIIKQVS